MPRIVRTVEVAVDPATAFAVFTDEIDAWYERGPHSWNDPDRAVAIRFEGGRLLEVYEDGAYEMGRVVAWEPGRRLAFVYQNVHLPLEGTEVEVRFEAVAGGTRITLEHRGLERLPAEEFALWEERAWIRFMAAFAAYVTS
ncbi:MAG: SRPBCC domain-containing protein [Actinobacteria bacterium]|nr:SRPBCC domain-containing protein [Actinomycetota bacterium]